MNSLGLKKTLCHLLPILLICPQFAFAQSAKLKDFKATNQRIALVGFFNEFVDRGVEKQLQDEIRKKIWRYSLVFSKSDVENFQLLENPNNQYFKVAPNELPEAQKEFLERLGKENNVEIIVLGNIRESFDGVELELQLYDARIKSLSEVKNASFNLQQREAALEELVYELMNHLDRDGFVWQEPQDFLEKPSMIRSNSMDEQTGFLPPSMDGAFVTPEDLGSSPLAGSVSIGGDKTPFWEQAWFWGVLGGGLVTAAGLGYYIYFVGADKTSADVTFSITEP